jgi:hypothetical protein
MNNAAARAEGNGGLLDPPLKRSAAGLIFYDTWREWLGSKWQIVTNAHGATDKFDIAFQRI